MVTSMYNRMVEQLCLCMLKQRKKLKQCLSIEMADPETYIIEIEPHDLGGWSEPET